MMPGMKKTMDEWKAGTLKSSSGAPVKNQKQAIAIGLSEQRKMKKFAEGGSTKPVYNPKGKTFDEQFPLPKPSPAEQTVRDRIRAAGAKKGGAIKKYAKGGGIEQRGKTRGKLV
jgi:hypothetical protein